MKKLKQIILFSAFALLTPMLAIGQDNQRTAELKARVTAPKGYIEAREYYAADDGYSIANSPKITPDRANYGVYGKIELVPSQNTFVARYYIEGLDSPDPRTRQIASEMSKLLGRAKTPYFQIRVPSELQKAYANNARMNTVINVVGTYVGNTEIVMTSKQRVQIPVLDALFLQFEDNGPIAMIPLKKMPLKAVEKSQPVAHQDTNDITTVLTKYKASFDCAKAGTSVEKMICTNARIGSLDGLLSATYKSRLLPEFGADPTIMRTEQRAWVGARNKCGDAECLAKAYTDRIKDLCSMPVTTGVHWDSDCDVLGQD